MNWNWKRDLAVTLFCNLFTFGVLPTPSAAQSNPCTESRAKRTVKNTVGGALAGAVIGLVVSKNNAGKATLIGASIGGGIGTLASVRKPAYCSEKHGKSFYNTEPIADASEPTDVASVGVLLRNVVGANPNAVRQALVNDLPKANY